MDRYEITFTAVDLMENLPPAISNRASDIIRNIDDRHGSELTEATLVSYWEKYTEAIDDLLFMILRIGRRHVFALDYLNKAFESRTPFMLYLRDFSIGKHHVWSNRYLDDASGKERLTVFELMPMDDHFIQQSVLKYSFDGQILSLSVQDFRSFDVSRLNPVRQAMLSLLLPGKHWQAVIDFLISQAAVIVLALREASPGTRVEIDRIHHHGKQAATVAITLERYSFDDKVAELKSLTRDLKVPAPDVPPALEREALKAALGEIENVIEFGKEIDDIDDNDAKFVAAVAKIDLKPPSSTYDRFCETLGTVSIDECLDPEFLVRLAAEIHSVQAFLLEHATQITQFDMARSLFDLACLHAILDHTDGTTHYLTLICMFFESASDQLTAAAVRRITVKFLADVHEISLDEATALFEDIHRKYAET